MIQRAFLLVQGRAGRRHRERIDDPLLQVDFVESIAKKFFEGASLIDLVEELKISKYKLRNALRRKLGALYWTAPVMLYTQKVYKK